MGDIVLRKPETPEEELIDSTARMILGFLADQNENDWSPKTMFSALLSAMWILTNICMERIPLDVMKTEGEVLARGLESLADLIRAQLAKKGNGLS